ncbi:MAG: aspartate kinase, partial [Candidatus Bathyarchaeia archaeon]
MKVVMKFGGTSVSTSDNIKRIAELIAHHAAQGNKIVAVVSAVDGITEKLSEAAELAEKG